MIRGMHGLFYSSEPEALRAFFRDKLGLKATDVGGGWPGGTAHISFFCDDLKGTMADLRKRGVEFAGVQDQGWGLVTEVKAPGGLKVQLYEPKYQK